MHLVGLNASRVSNKVDVFPVRRGKANKPHIELAHPRIVVMQLRDDNFVDELKVDRGGEALLGTKENAVSAFFQSIFKLPTSGQSGGRAGHDKQFPIRESSADFISICFHHVLMADTNNYNLILPFAHHVTNLPNFDRRIRAVVFLHSVGCSRDTEQQSNLLDQRHHAILAAIPGKGEVPLAHGEKLFHGLLIDFTLCRSE